MVGIWNEFIMEWSIQSMLCVLKMYHLLTARVLYHSAFVFSVAGALVVWEYDKSKKKEKLKELKTEKEHQEQDDRIAKLEDRLVSLEDSIRANLNSILEQQRLSVEPEIKRRRGWLW